MTNPIQNALNFLQTNNVKPNAQNMQYIQALQSGDKNAGQQLANQFCQLHDEIVANRMEDLKSKIADQAQEINQLNLSASQCQQNAYLISQLRPNPVPAFQVANPFASMYTGCCNNNVAI